MRHEFITVEPGVRLYTAMDGPHGDALPILFLHGFPESHRTWRHQMAVLAATRTVVAPDQRGFGRSDKPAEADAYRPRRLVADVIALADRLGWDRFVLAGHDWGGAVAWATALAHPDRLAGLAIANAPHPYLFQKALIENPAQRAASQYITAFRAPAMPEMVAAQGIEGWFDELLGDLRARGLIDAEEVRRYIRDWSEPGAVRAMLAWYAASPVLVPAPGARIALPWLDQPFPVLGVPTLVMWGLDDTALHPVLLEGLDALVSDLTIARIAGAGHFSPWEAPEAVTSALAAFLARI